MPTSYTSSLGLALPVTGELSGTWGDTVNNYITQYIDTAVAGALTVSTDTTLTKTTGSSLGSTSSQYAILIASGQVANITITAPAASKAYLVINKSGSYTVKICGTGPTTGITVAVSKAALVAWDGSDFALIATTDVTSLIGTLGVANGGTGATTLTANNVILGNGTSAVQFVAPGTNGNVLTSNGTTWTSAAAAATLSGTTQSATPFKTALGYQAGNVATGVNNTLVGYQSGDVVSTGNNNTALGFDTLGACTTGIWNTAIGSQSLQVCGTGVSGCTAVGFNTLSLASGNYNTTIGYSAGSTITSGSNNTVIGANADASSATVSNEVTIGSTSVTSTRLRGIVQHNAAILEQATVSATAATGTINYDVRTQAVLYYTTNASGNWTLNVRGSFTATLDSVMSTGQSITLAFLVTNGATAYYQTALTVDGVSVTPKWQGGTAPSSGNASSIDTYVVTIIKTGAATFTALESQTKFA